MELKRFIAATLTGIQEGVQAAIEQTKHMKGAINPSFGETSSATQLVQLVEFDVALTVFDPDRDGTEEIQVVSASVNGKGKKSKNRVHVSRVQFAIPILAVTQVIGAEDASATGGESLRRASKVANKAVRTESYALQGSDNAATPASEAPAEPLAEGT